MNFDQVTVFGGTGFVGRRIVQRLSEAGKHVRIAVRHAKPRQSSMQVGNRYNPLCLQVD